MAAYPGTSEQEAVGAVRARSGSAHSSGYEIEPIGDRSVAAFHPTPVICGHITEQPESTHSSRSPPSVAMPAHAPTQPFAAATCYPKWSSTPAPGEQMVTPPDETTPDPHAVIATLRAERDAALRALGELLGSTARNALRHDRRESGVLINAHQIPEHLPHSHSLGRIGRAVITKLRIVREDSPCPTRTIRP